MQLGSITGQIQKNGNLVGEISTVQNLVGELNNSIIELTPALEDLTVTPDVVEQNFKSDIYGYDNVKVKAIESEEITITPRRISQTKEGLYNKITVDGDSNLISSNIKEGVEIFGVTGTAAVRGRENSVIATRFPAGTTTSALPKYIKELNFIVTPTGSTCMFMFGNLEGLEKIKGVNTANVTTMGQMFYYCKALKEVPNINTSKATAMNSMFYNCNSIKTIPHFDTSNVTNMNMMFDACKSLIEVPLLNTSKVTNASYMFDGCTSLTTVPQFDMSSATNLNLMFTKCTALSNESLNNIMAMCINATAYKSKYAGQSEYMSLKKIGLTSAQATICKSLSNYQAFISAGWVTGY